MSLTPAQLQKHIAQEVTDKGLRAFGRQVELDPRYLKKIMGGEEPGDKALAKLGFRRVVRYERI